MNVNSGTRHIIHKCARGSGLLSRSLHSRYDLDQFSYVLSQTHAGPLHTLSSIFIVFWLAVTKSKLLCSYRYMQTELDMRSSHESTPEFGRRDRFTCFFTLTTVLCSSARAAVCGVPLVCYHAAGSCLTAKLGCLRLSSNFRGPSRPARLARVPHRTTRRRLPLPPSIQNPRTHRRSAYHTRRTS